MGVRDSWKNLIRATVITAVALCGSAVARAGVYSFQLGERDFEPDGVRITDDQIKKAGKGEPKPFNGTIFGDDRKAGAFGSIEYSHSFNVSVLSEGMKSALLTIGVIDVDSPPGTESPISLSFNGVVQPTEVFAGISPAGVPSAANVVSVPVPIDLLRGGKLTVDIATNRPAPGFPGNSLELDFSRLTIQTGTLDPSNQGGGGPNVPGGPVIPGGGGNGSGGTTDNGGGMPHAVPVPASLIPAALAVGLPVGYGMIRRRLRGLRRS